MTAPSARRRGVGRALLLRLAAHARAAGKARWRLNVKPENAAAIALYTRMGFALSSRAEVVRVPGWPDALPLDDDARVRVRRFTADEDRDLGPRLGFVDGQLALLRAHPDRVLAVAQREGRVVGGASFDPHFPGAFPFRADDLGVTGAILRFCAREAPTSSPWVQLVIEEHPALTAALVARGGTVMLETHHYEGEIPAETT